MNYKKAISVLIVLSITVGLVNAQSLQLADEPADEAKLTILYDNYVYTPGTQANWGFSCLVMADDQEILFDAGTLARILMKNIDLTNTDISTIDQILISHNHGDHTGGLWTLLEKKSDIPVHLPYPPDSKLKTRITNLNSIAKSQAEPFALTDHLWSSGTMGDDVHEQCIVIHHRKGLIVLTGCSHPGISEMLKQIKKEFGQEIYAVMGGFHLTQHSREQIEQIIRDFRELGVKKCGASHCTGEKQIQQFREAFGDDFLELGTGRVLEF